MDAIRVNIRSDGAVSNKAVFVALAILPDGTRDVLGLWFQTNEGAKFWASVLSDLRNRGVQNILIAVVNGLKGFRNQMWLRKKQKRLEWRLGFLAAALMTRLMPRSEVRLIRVTVEVW